MTFDVVSFEGNIAKYKKQNKSRGCPRDDKYRVLLLKLKEGIDKALIYPEIFEKQLNGERLELMERNTISCRPTEPLIIIINKFGLFHITGKPVMEKGQLVGIICQTMENNKLVGIMTRTDIY